MNKPLTGLLAGLALLAAPVQAEENPAVVDAIAG
jgi:hypothetical protein